MRILKTKNVKTPTVRGELTGEPFILIYIPENENYELLQNGEVLMDLGLQVEIPENFKLHIDTCYSGCGFPTLVLKTELSYKPMDSSSFFSIVYKINKYRYYTSQSFSRTAIS